MADQPRQRARDLDTPKGEQISSRAKGTGDFVGAKGQSVDFVGKGQIRRRSQALDTPKGEQPSLAYKGYSTSHEDKGKGEGTRAHKGKDQGTAHTTGKGAGQYTISPDVMESAMADVHRQLLAEYNEYNTQQTLAIPRTPLTFPIPTPEQRIHAALRQAHNLRSNLIAGSPPDIAAIDRINGVILNIDTLLDSLQATLPGLGRAGRIRRVGRAGW